MILEGRTEIRSLYCVLVIQHTEFTSEDVILQNKKEAF